MSTPNQAKAESALHYPLGEALPDLGSTAQNETAVCFRPH